MTIGRAAATTASMWCDICSTLTGAVRFDDHRNRFMDDLYLSSRGHLVLGSFWQAAAEVVIEERFPLNG